ncbi:hypothetical protein [Bradyrhizobium canariense]|uniref:Uncharacterized protein n=1 Tax=Bradyrhizobium canariense TaxID=255045 RepID=A0A1H1ZP74_9BRAD|nr:hypothetical protein [Bradyrhizobium canariense]SDT35611.1 hypothetical protein SAMN05444158_5583 [Bradyrhizobium canariense]
MVSAVSNNPSVLPPSQAQSQSKSSSSAGASFQQAVSQYLQNTTSGAGGASSAANPSQSLGSDLMSSLLQMQS